MYQKQDLFSSKSHFAQTDSGEKLTVAHAVTAVHFDFVAKPEGTRELNGDLGTVLSAAGLAEEGMETALLLVSDREARLVTLLTFWDASRLVRARERRIAWMQKLLAPFADGPIRAQTSTPRFVMAGARAEFEINDVSSHRSRELVQIEG